MSTEAVDSSVHYMLARSRECIDSGELAFAKCYLLAASVFVPDHLNFKYTNFNLYKIEENYEEAGKFFEELFAKVSFERIGKKASVSEEHRDIFKREMANLLFAIAADWQCFFIGTKFEKFFDNIDIGDIGFYRRLASLLKPSVLITCIDSFLRLHRDQQLLVTDLLLYVVISHPSEASNQARQLIELLETFEAQSDSEVERRKAMIEHLKERYVISILPALFSTPKIIDNHDFVNKYYYRALRYFLKDHILAHPDTIDEGKREKMFTALVKSLLLIGGSDIEAWKKVEIGDEDVLQLEMLDNLMSPFDDSTVDLKGKANVHYLLVLVVFLGIFGRYMNAAKDYILVERILPRPGASAPPAETKMAPKKRKLLPKQPSISGEQVPLVQSFRMLIKLDDLLVERFSQDFGAFLTQSDDLPKHESWKQFRAETFAYHGKYNEASALIAPPKIITTTYADCLSSIACQLELLALHSKQNDLHTTAKLIINIVDLLHSSPLGEEEVLFKLLDKKAKVDEKHVYCSLDTESNDQVKASGREMLFVDLSIGSVLTLLIEACILVVKEISFFAPRKAGRFDVGFGHLVVLSQFEWPFYYDLYKRTLAMLSPHASAPIDTNTNEVVDLSIAQLNYPQFMRFILLPEVLEDFMVLLESGEVFLQLSDKNEPMGARGVTRHYKEVLKGLLGDQVHLRSVNSIPPETFANFINTEIRAYFAEKRLL